MATLLMLQQGGCGNIHTWICLKDSNRVHVSHSSADQAGVVKRNLLIHLPQLCSLLEPNNNTSIPPQA